MKKIIYTFMGVFILVISILTLGFSKNSDAVSNWGKDWLTIGNNDERTRYVNDSELDIPIQFKAKMKLGWSTAQPIAVGDYIYHIASIAAGQDNLFNLPAGSYLYKLPADFRFFRPSDSESAIRTELIAKGATVVKFDTNGKSYGSPTWSPENQAFFLGHKESLYYIPADLKGAKRVALTGQVVGSPLVFDNDLVALGTGAGGGDITLVKGLSAGDGTAVSIYQTDNETNTEVSGTLSHIPGTTAFGIGINYRNSAQPGKFKVFRVNDNGYGKAPTIASPWKETYQTNIGVPTTAAYDGGYFYFSDKSGTAYKLRASDGAVAWKTNMANSTSITLVNNSPAMDTTNIYYPVRAGGGNRGKIVAVNKATGKVTWVAEQGEDKNGNKLDSNVETGSGIHVANDTTTWRTAGGEDLVFYGDTNGQLSFLHANGSRANVAIDYQNGTLTRSTINATSNGGVPGDWQVQGQGLATEVMLAKKHLVFGVNTSDTAGELWFYSVGMADDVYVKDVKGGNYKVGQDVLTKVTVGSKDFSVGQRVPYVRFYRDGVLVEQRRIDLMPGEEKELYFMWRANKKVDNGQLYVTINYNPQEFMESDFTNNYKTVKYTVGAGNQQDLCLPGENKTRGVVKRVTYTDMDGNSHTVTYYEYLAMTIDNVKPNKLRAGYGFSFEPTTIYVDETNSHTGPKRVETTFPQPVNYVPNVVQMEKKSVTNSGAEIVKWQLPLIYVEKYSGNLFYNTNAPERDYDDVIVDPNGERKWYTDFKTKDGTYLFKSVAKEAGKNNLSSCYTYDAVEIEGTPFDDYVRRSVIPDQSFLDGDNVGFNWKGEEATLGGLSDFYYNPNSNDGHTSTYFLNPDVIKEIQESDPEVLTKSETNSFFGKYNFDE